MQRRTFIGLAAAAPILVATPAMAGWEEGVAAIFAADPGQGARVTRTRSGFLLEVSGARFNIGMPPNLSAWGTVLTDILQAQVQIGASRASVEIVGARRAQVRKDSGDTVSVTLRGEQGLRALADTPEGRFAAFVGIAAAALGGDGLGRGGQGVVMSGGTTMQFLLEVSG